METLTYQSLKELIIEPKNHSPKIILDKYNNKFEISGISIPDNVNAIFIPVLKWLEIYKEMPNTCTEFNFRLEFLCQKSSEMISKIFEILQDIYNNGNEVIIKWYYHIDDDDMRIEGRHFTNNFSVPIELINYTTK